MPLQLLKKANGEEIVSVGDVVSYSIRGTIANFDVATQAPKEDIPRTSHIVVNASGEVSIHNTMHTYLFSPRKEGYVYKSFGTEYDLDAASNKIMQTLLQERSIVHEKVRDKRRSYVA